MDKKSGRLVVLQLFSILTAFCGIALGQASLNPTSSAKSSQPLSPRCGQIAASDPTLAPLSQACEYALSPHNFPNFICHEEEEQLARSPKFRSWHRLGLMTAEVTVEQRQEAQYSNVAMDGFPIRKLAGPHNRKEVIQYLEDDRLGGIPDLKHFGGDLLAAFAPEDRASFAYKGETNDKGIALDFFAFRIGKQDNHYSGLDISDGKSFIPGYEGLIWIRKNDYSLRRIVMHATEINSKFPINVYSSATDYSFVDIPDLGQFLLPTDGESLRCDRRDRCWNSVQKVKNCHKFGAQSRIVPGNAH